MGQWAYKGRGRRQGGVGRRMVRKSAHEFTCEHEPDIMQDREGWRAWAFDWSIGVRCPWGNCTIDLCGQCGAQAGGVGPMGCLCDLTKGWRAKRVDNMGKPSVPVKAKGRHGSRVQRSRHRKAPAIALQKRIFAAMGGLEEAVAETTQSE